MGYGTMLIPQDVIRREIVRVKDNPDNPAIQLIYDIALYGRKINYDVIIEGILTNERYGDMLRRLFEEFDKSYAFYFDVSFEETLKRHQTKSNSGDFNEKEMKEWWVDNDFLRVKNEVTINSNLSEDEAVEFILRIVKHSRRKF